MKKYISILLILILSCAMLLSLTACDDDSDGVIRLNEVTHSIFYAPQYVAMALGYFEDEGITIELTNGAGADNVMTALLADEADIGLMGCETNIYVNLEGMTNAPVVVAQLTKRDGSFLVGREYVEDFDYSDIDGSSVLMGRTAGMPAMILQYVLNGYGYYNDDNIVMDYSLDFGSLSQAFAGGYGDYVPLFEPTASEVVSAGYGYILTSIGQDSGEIPYTCYTVSQEYLDENPELVEKFIECVWRGTEYVMTHTAEEVALLLSDYFETDMDIIISAVSNYQEADVWMGTPVTSEDGFERLQDIMENAGELSSRVDYDDIVNTTIATTVYNTLNS